jgi:hypothetical protein
VAARATDYNDADAAANMSAVDGTPLITPGMPVRVIEVDGFFTSYVPMDLQDAIERNRWVQQRVWVPWTI